MICEHPPRVHACLKYRPNFTQHHSTDLVFQFITVSHYTSIWSTVHTLIQQWIQSLLNRWALLWLVSPENTMKTSISTISHVFIRMLWRILPEGDKEHVLTVAKHVVTLQNIEKNANDSAVSGPKERFWLANNEIRVIRLTILQYGWMIASAVSKPYETSSIRGFDQPNKLRRIVLPRTLFSSAFDFFNT